MSWGKNKDSVFSCLGWGCVLVSDQWTGSGDNHNYRHVIIARAAWHVSDLPLSCQPLSLEVIRRSIGHYQCNGLQGQAMVGSCCPGVSEGGAGTGDRETPHSIEWVLNKQRSLPAITVLIKCQQTTLCNQQWKTSSLLHFMFIIIR